MRTLVSDYSALLKGTSIQADALLAYMKKRGHLSLLTQIIKELERAPVKKDAVVKVAAAHDAERYAKQIASHLSAHNTNDYAVEVDEKIVGGYEVSVGETLYDNTFRSALVSIYKNAVLQK